MDQEFYRMVNKEFIIVFNPKDKAQYNNRKYFIVKASQLHKYIGEDNAEKAFIKAMKSKDQRWTRKYREHGYIMFYRH